MQTLKSMAERAAPDRYLGLSVQDAVRLLTQTLMAAGLETPAVDARLLVPAVLGVSKRDLILNPHRCVTAGEARHLAGFEARRLAHEPVSRILGAREFFGRTFAVTPAALDPRPDSETLVEAALEIARSRGAASAPLRILDIGTGTGCLLLTLLAELEGATGLGTDVSAAALDVAAANADRLGLGGRARWLQMRSLEGLSEPFDLIISNPPYIPTLEIDDLQADVKLYDPRIALDGGPDGFDIYREIAAGLVRTTGFEWALFEVGAGQAASLERLLRDSLAARVRAIKTWQDLGGHVRCVAVQTH